MMKALSLSLSLKGKTQNGTRGNSPEVVAEFVVAVVVVVAGVGANLGLGKHSLSLCLSRYVELGSVFKEEVNNLGVVLVFRLNYTNTP